MLQNTKLRLQEVIKETGMKIWDLEEDMLEDGRLVRPLCGDTTGKTQLDPRFLRPDLPK